MPGPLSGCPHRAPAICQQHADFPTAAGSLGGSRPVHCDSLVYPAASPMSGAEVHPVTSVLRWIRTGMTMSKLLACRTGSWKGSSARVVGHLSSCGPRSLYICSSLLFWPWRPHPYTAVGLSRVPGTAASRWPHRRIYWGR